MQLNNSDKYFECFLVFVLVQKERDNLNNFAAENYKTCLVSQQKFAFKRLNRDWKVLLSYWFSTAVALHSDWVCASCVSRKVRVKLYYILRIRKIINNLTPNIKARSERDNTKPCTAKIYKTWLVSLQNFSFKRLNKNSKLLYSITQWFSTSVPWHIGAPKCAFHVCRENFQ